jgi:leader peptidase (prepilin peptidase)/N-methyltransferase
VNFLALPFWLLAIFLFAFGAVCGSFLNVCIHRFPDESGIWQSLKAIAWPPSRCPRCRTHIRWHDNIPLVGWLVLRGRCRDCKMWISPRYPAVELLNGLLFVLLYWMEIPHGFSPQESCLFTADGPEAHPGLGMMSAGAMYNLRYLFHLVLIESLVIASFIDMKLRIIPDACTLPALAVAIVAHFVVGRLHLVPVWMEEPLILQELTQIFPWLGSPAATRVPAWIDAHPHWHGLAVSVAGLVVGGGVTFLVRVIGRWILKKEAMGDGDVVLMAVIGAFLGWQASLLVFAIAPACALVVVAAQRLWRSQSVIPYGPYLSLATLVVLLNWQTLWQRTAQYFLAGRALLVVGVVMMGSFAALLYLMQLGKRAVGIADAGDGSDRIWGAADQNQFFAGEHFDRHQGNWRRDNWRGASSGTGTLHYERWRGH